MHGLIAIGNLAELALMNAGLFILFACGFFKTTRKRDWRSIGPLRAFFTALFTEMYGVPLTVYLLAGWFQPRLPGIDTVSKARDELLQFLFGWRPNPHVGIFQLTGLLVTGAGVALAAVAWKQLYNAERDMLPCSREFTLTYGIPSISASSSSCSEFSSSVPRW